MSASTLISGVNPNIQYPRLYRVFAELWIYMGLAWLSLFFSWNVHMVVEAHKVLKKRRHKHRHFYDEEPQHEEEEQHVEVKRNVIDIFNFLSEKDDDDYSTVIKEIGMEAKRKKPPDNINRSKSCSDIVATNIRTLDRSPRHRRMISISEVFMNAKTDGDENEKEETNLLLQEQTKEPGNAACVKTEDEKNKDRCVFDFDTEGIVFTAPTTEDPKEEIVQHPDSSGSRFKISKVVEEDLLLDKDEKG